MSYLRYPSYYEQFRCIASDCTDSCCIADWEVDIDGTTLQEYQQIGGSFGKQLRSCISPPTKDAPAHFIFQNRQCPFLNTDHLCDIVLTLGEQYLCQICAAHPRYFSWFSEGKEAGVGLCCEAAAELILQKTDGVNLKTLHIDSAESDTPDDSLLPEQQLFSMRDTLFHNIKPGFPVSLDKTLDQLYRTALQMQESSDEFLYSIPPSPEGFADAISWSSVFWKSDYLEPLLEYYLALDLYNPTFRELLHRAKNSLSLLLQHRSIFLADCAALQYEYEQLLIYFIYRHFMSARNDGAILDKVVFALLSTCIIQLLGIQAWLPTHTFSHRQQIDLCKLYSQEIEYDEENTSQLCAYPQLP